MSKIVLVESDEKLSRFVLQHVRGAGYEADWLRDGRAALEVEPAKYALWILALVLPKIYGLDVLKHIRRASDAPIIVMSAEVEPRTRIRALELGGDDYLTKPIWPGELIARIQARMRRPNVVRNSQVILGGLVLDLEAHRLTIDGESISLTRVEFDLLAALVGCRGGTLQRGLLAQNVLDPARDGTMRTLDVHVSRLRRKLGLYARCIVTVFGVGYRFDEECAP